MISRVADHLFWLGRYLERAESSARVCLVTRNLALDGELEARQAWQPAIVVSGEEQAFRTRHGDEGFADGEKVQDWLAWEESNHSSLLRTVMAARDNARSVREVLSLETWEAVNELHLWMRGSGQALWRDDRHGFYRSIRQAAQLCLGVVHGTMLHDDGFDLILLGVMLERNQVEIVDIVSVILSATPDLRADFPAVAARSIGLEHTPLLCCQEIPVEGAIGRCVRVLIHTYLPGDGAVHHVYLHGARQLRLDLPE